MTKYFRPRVNPNPLKATQAFNSNLVTPQMIMSSYQQASQSSAASNPMAIAKQVFPNLDPTFFTPPHVLRESQAVDIRNPYSTNAWVYAACSAISTPLIQLPKVLDDNIQDESEPIEEHDILTLLNNPNPLMDGPTFWENIILDLMLPTDKTKGGQCFIVSENGQSPVDLTKGELPREFFPFSDLFFEPVVDPRDKMLRFWKFKLPNSSQTILYRPEEIIRIHLVDPLNPLAGQAPIWAARQGLRADTKAAALNENFFDNNASLGGVIETDASLDSEQVKELRDSWEEAYAGQLNAGRVPILHKGLKYQMFQQTHQDMQFLEQKKYTREEILAVYKVPKFAVSLYEDINFATATAAVRTFWAQTLLPLDDRINRAFNDQWVKFISPGNLRLESNLSKVPALQPDLNDKLEQAKKLFDMHVPLDIINERLELQLDLSKVEWSNTHLVNFNQMPAEDALENEPPAQNSNDNEETSGGPIVDEDNEDNEDKVEAAIKRVYSTIEKQSREEKNRDLYINNVLIPDENKFHKILTKYFVSQRNQVQDRVDTWERIELAKLKSITKQEDEEFKPPTPASLTNFIAAENKRLQKATRPEYQRQAENEVQVITAELDELNDFRLNSPTMRDIVKERLKQITSINTTTFKAARSQISDVLEESINEGWGVKQTARELKKSISKVYKGRINSVTIARTETASIHSQTRLAIYEAEGIKNIKWMTAGDEGVRSSPFSHKTLNNKTALISKGFNNGEKIRFPLDPKASSSNVINCRCTVISVRSKDA